MYLLIFILLNLFFKIQVDVNKMLPNEIDHFIKIYCAEKYNHLPSTTSKC